MRQQNVYSTGNYRNIFYDLCYSYSKYLIETYGINSFMELYESNDLFNDYNEIFGKSYEEVKDDWYKYLESFTSTMTHVELNNRIIELFISHNYQNY